VLSPHSPLKLKPQAQTVLSLFNANA